MASVLDYCELHKCHRCRRDLQPHDVCWNDDLACFCQQNVELIQDYEDIQLEASEDKLFSDVLNTKDGKYLILFMVYSCIITFITVNLDDFLFLWAINSIERGSRFFMTARHKRWLQDWFWDNGMSKIRDICNWNKSFYFLFFRNLLWDWNLGFFR